MPVSKLTETQVRDILLKPDSAKLMANRYGVSSALIYMIRRRKIWKHVVTGETPRPLYRINEGFSDER
jgi:hypothetical protein